MTTFKFTLVLVLISFSCFCQKSFDYHKDFAKLLSESSKPKSEFDYNRLLERFLENDTSLNEYEIIALQIGHTNTKYFDPYMDIEIERAIYSLSGSGKHRASLELADSYQKRNPLSLMLNLEKSYSFHKKGNQDSSIIYYNRYLMLVNADIWSGNGHDKPYFVLGPIDGQVIIERFWQGEIIQMGSAFDKHDYFLDVLTMKDKKTKEETTLKFIIEHASNEMFSEEEKMQLKVKKVEK